MEFSITSTRSITYREYAVRLMRRRANARTI